MRPSILVVDDEHRVALTTQAILQMHGYAVQAVSSADEALRLLPDLRPALVISDVVMPGMNGVDMAMLIRAIHPHCRILLISGNATTQDLLDGARQHGERFDVLAKPVPPRQLLEKVSLLLGRNHRAIA